MRYTPKNVQLMVNYIAEWERQGHIVSVGRKAVTTQFLRWALGTLRNQTILDVGCGTGHLVDTLCSEGADCYGVDLVSEYFFLPEGWGKGRLVHGDVQELPFREETFDAALALDVLEHCGDMAGGLGNIRRVLKPGGRLLLTLPAMNLLYSQLDELQGHECRFYRGEVIRLLEANGYTVERATYFFSFLTPPMLYKKFYHWYKPIPPHLDEADMYPMYAMPSKPVLSILWWMLRREIQVLKNYDLPFGTTLLVVARRGALR